MGYAILFVCFAQSLYGGWGLLPGTPPSACLVPFMFTVGRSRLLFPAFPSSLAGPVPRTTSFACTLDQDWNWLHGQRVGEATNPGPARQLSLLESLQRGSPPPLPAFPMHLSTAATAADDTSRASGVQPSDCSSSAGSCPVATDFKLAVINPTAVLGKETDILALQQDMVLLSETSAVERAQRMAATAFRQAQCYSQWSPPVPPHSAGLDSLRGHAEGTAVVSRHPLRGSFTGRPDAWNGSCRLVEAIARVGWFSFRVITVYGFPANRTEAAYRNDELFRLALQVANQDHLPTLIGGDLNCRVQSLPVWDDFRALGFQEAFEYWEHRSGTALPPTCRAATRHDTVLLPPVFQQMLRQAEVATTLHVFDSHAPLLLEFRIPVSPILQHRWRMPRSWAGFDISPESFAIAYRCRRHVCQQATAVCQSQDDVDRAFTIWAQQVEDSVDACLREAPLHPAQQHAPGLPRACRGRFQYRPRLGFHLPSPARPARHGDYNPPAEVMTVVGRAKVKQVRRLRTFAAGLAKARRCGAWTPSVLSQLEAEWAAIKRGQGYGSSFAQWLLRVAHFEVFWEAWPPAAWLEDVVAYVAYDADLLARAEAKRTAKLREYRANQDAICNHAKGHFAALRDPMRPPITSIPKTECQQAVKVQDVADAVATYRLPCPQAYTTALPTTADGETVQLQGVVHLPDELEVLQIDFQGRVPPATCSLQQVTEASTGPDLHRAFFEYWAPIWLRDTAADNHQVQPWADFLQHLPPVPSEAASLCDFDSFDPTVWADRAKHLKAGKATGYDGISNEELKRLPFEATSDLADIFRQCSSFGWPRHLASATVSSLAKNDCPQGLHHSRPITILATSYRLWASVAARGILRAWNQWFPAEILGCLPGRSSRDLSLSLECLIEQARLANEPLLGFSIDLVKAFNNLPRRPLRELLLHLQVPPVIVATWFSFLDQVARFPTFHESLGPGLPSTTGVPEGDPLSVVAMLAVCYAAHHWPRSSASVLRSYIDNFTWTCTEPTALPEAVASARAFCLSLRLPIDWTKSYCWATLSAHRRWLHQIAHSLVPEGHRLQVVDGAKDLGVCFRFGSQATTPNVTARLQKGHGRLLRLGSMSRPIDLKARMVLSSVWPATFYGTEGHRISAAQHDSLRTAAARALVGKYSSTSPALALTCLSDRVLDPAVYGLAQALCALARLLRVAPKIGDWWLQQASSLNGPPKRSIGPATNLARSLHDHGWVLKADGLLKGPDHWKCHLRLSSSAGIKQAVAGAWCAGVPALVAHRNGLRHLTPPSPRVTARALKAFKVGEQRHLARAVVGGFMSAAARSTWDPLVEATCELCGGLDTKHHRLLHCPAVAQARRPFQELLQWVQSHVPHWLHCPFAVEHEQECFSRLFWESRKLLPPPDVSGLVQAHDLEQLCLYTDGSCNHSSCPEARHAAWAVVVDLRPHERLPPGLPEAQLDKVARTRFVTVAQGVVPGRQTNNRAEFCALLQAARISSQCPVLPCRAWSDSQFGLTVQHRLQQCPELPREANVADLGDGDVFHWFPPAFSSAKVQAHRRLESVPPADLVRAVGNYAADLAAKQALRQDLPLAGDMCDAIASWRREQGECLRWFYQYLLEVTKVVVPARRAVQKSGAHEAGPSNQPLDQPPDGKQSDFQLWLALSPEEAQPLALREPPAEVLQQGGWPAWFLEQVWVWTSQLQWGRQDHLDRRDRGITYLELLANFVVSTGTCPPVTGASPREMLDPLTTAGVLQPLYLRNAVAFLVQAVRFLERRTKTKLWIATLTIACGHFGCLAMLLAGKA